MKSLSFGVYIHKHYQHFPAPIEIRKLDINSSDAAEDGIFQLIALIPCLLMAWLLKSPRHQQAQYWLCVELATCTLALVSISTAQNHIMSRANLLFFLGMTECNQSSWDAAGTFLWRSPSRHLSRCWTSLTLCRPPYNPQWDRCDCYSAASVAERPATSEGWPHNSASSCPPPVNIDVNKIQAQISTFKIQFTCSLIIHSVLIL